MDVLLSLFSINVAHAESLDSFIGHVDAQIVNPLISLLVALAVVFFLYGILEFIMNQEDEQKRTDGKSHMFWGIIGISIMIGVWGILNVVLNTIGIPKSQINPQQGTVQLP